METSVAERVEHKTKQKGVLFREFNCAGIELRKAAEGDAYEIELSASSEYPVERWYGTEVLSHDPGAVILDRASRGAMPVLFNHRSDMPVGIVTSARIEKKRLLVTARLFKTTLAEEVRTMIEGGLRNVSIGYVTRIVEENMKEERFTATEWEPYEVSIVTVPADPTVGIDRGQEYEFRMFRAVTTARGAITREDGMEEGAAGAAATAQPAARSVVVETAARESAEAIEKNRIRAIKNLCAINKIDERLSDHWIRSGMSVDKVTDDMLAVMEERGKHNPESVSRLGLSDRESKKFSLTRAVLASVDNSWNNAPFELECSREIATRLNRPPDPRRFFVPFEVQERPNPTPVEVLARMLVQRDMTVGASGQGGYLVQTSNVGFIELLRNKSVIFNMGATRLSGLRDSITIPKQTVAATSTWLANEASQISEVNQTFVQIAMSPKTVGGYTEISRQLLMQSNPSIEGIVSADLAQVVALDIDLKALNGSGGSGQPTGIINTSGIGSVTGTSLAYAGIVEFQTDVFGGNTLTGRCGYVTTGVVAGLMKGRVKFTSTASPVWEGRLEEGVIDGYRAMASNQVPAGNMLFGDFGQVIIGEWGVLEVETNPFADFKAGIIGVRAIASIDVAVRYPAAFSLATSIT